MYIVQYHLVVRTRCSTVNNSKLDGIQQHGQIPKALSWLEKSKKYL